MLGPTTLNQLAQVVHQERVRELEHEHRVREALRSQSSGRKIHSVILAGLGRRLIEVGEDMIWIGS